MTIVTGAGRGVGRATAQRLAADGARLGLTDVDAAALEETTALVREAGGAAVATAGDIVDPATIDDLTGQVVAAYGRVDGLVNNAGIVIAKPILEYTVADFDRLMHVNVLAHLVTAQRVVPEMVKTGSGSVVNVASIGALAAIPLVGVYCASKAAVLGFTRSLALEHAPAIRVNAVCPGGIETEMAEEHIRSFATREEAITTLAGRQMLKRYARPEEIANAIAFLVSDDSSFITGAAIPVEAGWTAW
ncbi:Enoyl-(Acyl carrier protein) reductase [Microlunatus sagamiharensis]|uniref:Enoyl-(Acyl carrier protein) reductase n=1 Tax=Microlunatus sagamiharensis TaxID=546874 RepID=A0A1H2N1L4_9ACTN|nr:Enoyl-(Acyl carrier protein) reductase [Microlunatus sagamiharensis]